jgi:hypothetical protein
MIAQNFNEEDWERNGPSDMEQIWKSKPGKFLCERHREKARNDEPTDCSIEDLRNERYGTTWGPEYFRRCIVGLAQKYDEIETKGGNVVRLTPFGLNSCRSIPGWQMDF